MSLQRKVSALFSGLAIIVVTGLTWLQFSTASASLESATYDRLTALRESKRRQIEQYFDALRRDLSTFAAHSDIVAAATELSSGFARSWSDTSDDPVRSTEERDRLAAFYEANYTPRFRAEVVVETPVELLPDSEAQLQAQSLYIQDNPAPIGAKDDLADAGDGSSYSRAHAQWHERLRQFQREYGFYDVFVIDAESDRVVYSVFKEMDFGSDLVLGPYRTSALAAVYQEVKRGQLRGGRAALIDFLPYTPSYGAPASFLASPLVDEDGDVVAVLAAQAPIDAINAIMTGEQRWTEEGLGKSGETYLVGPDFLMRSDSRFLLEDEGAYLTTQRAFGVDDETLARIEATRTTVLAQRVDTVATRDALGGGSSTEIIDDYRGVPVLSSYTPVNINGYEWALLSEIDAAEAFAPVRAQRNKSILFGLVSAAIFAVAGHLLARRLTMPLRRLESQAHALGEGDLSRRVDEVSGDEIGDLAHAFNQMASNLQRTTVSRDYVDGVIRSMGNALFVMDTDDDLTIRTTNTAATKLIGCDADAIIGRSFRDLVIIDFDTDGDIPLVAWLRTCAADSDRSAVEIGLKDQAGAGIPIDLTVSTLHLGGADRFVCVAQDLRLRKQLESTIAEKRMIEHDLAVARQIQRNLLPEKPPTIDNYAIAGWSEAAQEAGGDHFDWIPLPDGRFVVTIADVTGHGIGPAIATAICRAYARATFVQDEPMASLMARVNDLLTLDMPPDRFITYGLVVLDPSSQHADLLLAGHGPVLVYRAASNLVEISAPQQPPLTVIELDPEIETERINLAAGDAIFLMSDGFWEWRDGDGEQWGIERLSDSFRRHASNEALTVEDVIQAVHADVSQFVGHEPMSDDMTAVVIRRTAISGLLQHAAGG